MCWCQIDTHVDISKGIRANVSYYNLYKKGAAAKSAKKSILQDKASASKNSPAPSPKRAEPANKTVIGSDIGGGKSGANAKQTEKCKQAETLIIALLWLLMYLTTNYR